MKHKVKITFEDGCVSTDLICPPDDSCLPGQVCGACGRDAEAPVEETGPPCYDCPSPAVARECWLKTWFDNDNMTEFLSGEVTVEIDAAWFVDCPNLEIVSETETKGWGGIGHSDEFEHVELWGQPGPGVMVRVREAWDKWRSEG